MKITYPNGYYVTRVFDSLDRLTSIAINGASAPVVTFSYDGLNRRTQKFYNNGANTPYSYDIGNNLLSTGLIVGSTFASWSFDYNKVHQVIGKLTYDSTWEWLLSTAADVAYTVNNLNAYTAIGSVTPTYDSAGRLTNDGNFTYIYNSEHMLTEVKNAAGTAVVATYTYDPFKRQGLKTVGATLTRYVYAGTQLMEEYDCSAGLPGTLVRRYVYGAPEEVLFQTDGSGNVTYVHTDRQGSVIAQTSNTGAVVEQYTYSPFGESSELNGTTVGYTGQRYDSETGLYYYKSRHYSPAIGRFLQPDPIGYAAG